jgi:1-acyl-sn-glycerol-3-phosphate acyltransferase
MLVAVVLFEALVIGTAPLLLLTAAIVGLFCRSTLPVRTVMLVVAYAVIELTLLPRLLRPIDDWDALVVEVLDLGYAAMGRILGVALALEDGSATAAEVGGSEGLIVLARHCGPGDSVFIAWLLASHYRLSLRIVLKALLRLEPAVDLAGDHLPFCFVGSRRGAAKRGVAALASSLGAGDALLLFPEGGNFTWERWRESVRRLVARGEHLAARRARRNTHTLPPRPGGAVAALTSAPRADVLLLAHSGFGRDGRDRPWWRLPMKQDLVVRTVLLPAASVPRDPDGARAFLDEAWNQVDTWVEGHADLLALAPRAS